ncbi:hypothetical protein ACFX12_025239 [Malus domestica]
MTPRRVGGRIPPVLLVHGAAGGRIRRERGRGDRLSRLNGELGLLEKEVILKYGGFYSFVVLSLVLKKSENGV